jgi:gliding motility-associated-like protein
MKSCIQPFSFGRACPPVFTFLFVVFQMQLFAQLRTTTTADLFLCTAKSVALSTSPSGGTAPYSYTWSPAGTLSSAASPNPVASPLSTTTYTVTITDGALNSIQDSVTVNIGNFPPDIGVFPSADTICAGDTLQLELRNQNLCAIQGVSCITTPEQSTLGTALTQTNSSAVNPYHVNQLIFIGSLVRSNKRQLIYKASELESLGLTKSTNITSLAFFTTSFFSSWTYQDFTIKMGCVPDSSFPSTSYFTGLETVFNPKTVTVNSGSMWTEHAFDRAYTWDGTSSLVVEICFNNPTDIGFGGPTVQFETISSGTVLFRTGGTDVCGTSTGTNTTPMRPNTRFGHCKLVHHTPLTLSWSPGVDISSTSVPNPTVFPSTSTDYIVTATDTNACVSKDTVSITVASSFTITPTMDSILCESDSFSLVAMHNAGLGATLSWAPSLLIGSPSSAITKGFVGGSTDFILQVTSAGGCEKTDTFNVDIAPSIDLEILTPDSSICLGDSIFIDVKTKLTGCSTSPTPCASTTDATLGSMSFAFGGATASPFGVTGFNQNSQRKQLIIRQTELQGLGITEASAIQSLAININHFNGATSFDNFTIKMGCTSLNEFSAFPLSTFESGLQTVRAPATVGISAGWNVFTFDNTFNWDGTSNIIVEFCFENVVPLSIATDNQSVWSTNPGYASVLFTAGTGICSGPITASATSISFFRPDIRFAYCIAPPRNDLTYSWLPVAGLNDPSLAEPSAAPGVTTSYILTATTPFGSCTEKDTISITVAPNFTTSTSPDTTLCVSALLPVMVNHTSPSPAVVSWEPSSIFSNPSISTPSVTINQSEALEVRVSSNGCTKFDSISVILLEPMVANAETDKASVCIGNAAQLVADLQLSCGVSEQPPCASPSSITPITGTVSSLATSNVSFFLSEALATKRQFLFRKAELVSAGMATSGSINDLGFSITVIGSLRNFDNFVVRMGCTDASQLSPTFEVGLSTVFDAKTLTIVPGVNTIELDRGFNWDGQSNIVIELCYLNTGFPSPFLMNSRMEYTSPGYAASIIRNANTNTCNSPTGSPLMVRPTVEFGFCPFSPAVTYSWTPPLTLNDPSLKSPAASPLFTTSYVVTVTDTVSGCAFRDSIEVKVSDFFIEALADTTVCYAEGFQLNVESDAKAPATYQWLPASNLDDASLRNPIIVVEGGGMYIVEVTDSAGCAKLDTSVISTHPVPAIDITPDTTICRSVPLNLYASGGSDYLWIPDNGLSNAFISNPVLTGLKNKTTYLVAIFDANGCIRYDSVVVDLFPSPVIDFGNDTAVCEGFVTTLNAGAGFNTYQWQDGSTTQTVEVVPPGQFFVNATDNFNCTIGDTISYALFPSPTPPFDPHYFLCENASLPLDAQNKGSSFLWSTGEQTQSVIIDTAGTYWVAISNGFCEEVDSFHVTGLPYPVPTMPDVVSFCEQEQPFGVPVRAGGEEYIYHWSNGKRSAQVELAEPGAHTVEISNSENCSILDTVLVILHCESTLYVPNSFTPNDDLINDYFSIRSNNLFNFNIQIFDRWGKLLYESSRSDFQWDGKHNNKLLSQGVYIWSITYDERQTDGTFKEKRKFGDVLLLK